MAQSIEASAIDEAGFPFCGRAWRLLTLLVYVRLYSQRAE